MQTASGNFSFPISEPVFMLSARREPKSRRPAMRQHRKPANHNRLSRSQIVAGNNHKPKEQSAPNGIKPERRLKVSSMLAERKNKVPGPGSRIVSMKVPWIRIQGKWLEQAGFSIHSQVRVRVMKGCLVLTID